MDSLYQAHNLTIAAAVTLTLLAVHSDYRQRIIPNYLTLPAIALGLVLNTACNGWQGLFTSFLGTLLGIGLMILPFLFGRMGGGDVKFMAALGAIFGAYPVLNIFLYTSLAGGLFAIVVAILNHRLLATLKNVWVLVSAVLVYRCPAWKSDVLKTSIHIPYGFAIGAGTFCYLLIGNIV
jgi:prepilin peptidase CpaA